MKKRQPARPGRKPDLTPKIPSFKFSTANKSDAAYRDRLRVLKEKYGVKTSLRVNAKLTPSAKGAITRQTRKLAVYLNPGNRFQFVKADAATLRKVRGKGTAPSQAVTGKGVFVQLPESKHRSRVSVTPKGEVAVYTGSLRSTKASFKTADVLRDPEMILREASKRGAKSVFVSVRGLRGQTKYTLKAFANYITARTTAGKSLRKGLAAQLKDGKGIWKNRFQVEFVGVKTTKRKAKK